MNDAKTNPSNNPNMNASRYKLIFKGQIIEGNEIEEVRNRIADHFRIGEEKIERLFSGRPILIRKNVDFLTARRFQNIFQKAGAICEMIEIKEEEPQNIQSREEPPVSVVKKEAFVPIEILHWNWGAFLLTWIWGLGNKVYISLLSFVPIIGMFIPFLLGWKGNEWAWKNKKWENVEHFKKVQKKWLFGGIVISLVGMIASVLVFIFSLSQISSQLSTYETLLQSGGVSFNPACARNRIKIQTAFNQAYQDGAITKEDQEETLLQTLSVLGYLTEIPECSSGGHYFIKNGIVHCSIHGP
jgi:hypothetical protein